MQTLIVEIDNAENAQKVAEFLKEVKPVKSIKIRKDKNFLEGKEWVKSGRPSTDEEVGNLILKGELGKGVELAVSKKRTLKEFEKWMQKNFKGGSKNSKYASLRGRNDRSNLSDKGKDCFVPRNDGLILGTALK